jgi:outer membrane lipopolysaccharide assembly protein LptE/RlpB
MSKRLQNNQPFLHLLSRSSAKRRKALVKQATKDELAALFEICFNILRGNVPLNSYMKKKLKRERKTLRVLSDKKLSLQAKKKVVNQKGGFLGTIASIALPLLASLLLKK